MNGKRDLMTALTDKVNEAVDYSTRSVTDCLSAMTILHNAKTVGDTTVLTDREKRYCLDALRSIDKQSSEAIQSMTLSANMLSRLTSAIRSDLEVKNWRNGTRDEYSPSTDKKDLYRSEGMLDLIRDIETVRNVIYHFCALNRHSADILTKNTNSAIMAECSLVDLDTIIEKLKGKGYDL